MLQWRALVAVLACASCGADTATAHTDTAHVAHAADIAAKPISHTAYQRPSGRRVALGD